MKLAEGAGEVGFDRLGGDEQLLGDLAVGLAIGAVLLYRIMTFKLAGLIWVMYLHLHSAGKPGNHAGSPPLSA